MSTLAAPRPAAPPPAPPVVSLSVALWLGAILAGIAEALTHLLGPVPPTAGELAVRGGIYLVLAVLVLQLHTGRPAARWAVLGVLGGLGTLSLVVEPARALLDGATVAGFLTGASAFELAVTALRMLHVAEVLAAAALLFHPAARAFFRAPGRRPAAVEATVRP